MDFPFSFPCPNCDSKLKIKDASTLGRTVMCPQCGKKMTAEAPPDRTADEKSLDFDDEPELLKSLPPRRSKSKARDDTPRSIERLPQKKKKAASKSRSCDSVVLPIIVGGAILILVSLGAALWMFGGRIAVLAKTAHQQPAEAANTPVDPYAEAIKEAEAGERPFLVAAKPFLEAVRGRNYAAVYQALSSRARAAVQPEQFVTPTEERHAAQPLMNDISEAEFLDSMKKMEAVRGIPVKVLHFYVTSTDSKVLAGNGDPFESMLAIGGMPKEIPAMLRKASLRAQIQCDYSDEQVKQIARETGATEDQIRKGKPDGKESDDDLDEKPYLNLKFVLIEEAGELKVGYFEFMPPSILD